MINSKSSCWPISFLLRGIIFYLMLLLPVSTYSAEPPSKIHKRGLDYSKNRDYDRAVQEFNRAIDVHRKSSAKVHHNKGWTLELKKDYKGAIKSYKEAWRLNPKQIHTGERLGYMYYITKDWIKAVEVGERVLKLDPKNRPVPKWLPDAYLKKLRMQKELDEARKRKEEEEAKKRREAKKREEDAKAAEKIFFYGTVDFMLRLGYFPKGANKGWEYVEDRGLVDVPETVYGRLTPDDNWRFDLILENPYLGAIAPNLVVHSEKVEVMYWLGEYMIGAGFLVNHYAGKLAFGKDEQLYDYKVGYIFGFKKKRASMRFTLYPRLLLRDSEASSGQTYDVNSFSLEYTYNVDANLKYYAIFYLRDYYFFDHGAGLSDYYGVYDFGIGVTLGNLAFNPRKAVFAFTIEFIQRYYLENLANDDPYGTFNGQGWFGINSEKWLKGSPFSGGKGTSSQLTFKVEERFRRNFFFYQEFLIEIGELSGDENHHEFNLTLGAGIIF